MFPERACGLCLERLNFADLNTTMVVLDVYQVGELRALVLAGAALCRRCWGDVGALYDLR